MMDGGPYRGGAGTGFACPRCAGPMTGDPIGQMACASGCGAWWSKETLADLLSWSELEASEPDVRSLLDEPFPPVRCPRCFQVMTVSVHAGVAFDHCGDHGVWLDAQESEQFARAFQLAAGALRG